MKNSDDSKFGSIDPNLTFHPQRVDRLLYDEKAIDRLHLQQKRLKGELVGLNEMITDMLDKKHEVLN